MTPPDPDHTLAVPRLPMRLRLDAYLAKALPQYSRSQIQRWIRAQAVLVSGKPAEPSQDVKGGEDIRITIPPEEISVLPEEMPLEVLFEDDSILVVNKPVRQVTHPAYGNYTGTLLNAVAHHLLPSPRRDPSPRTTGHSGGEREGESARTPPLPLGELPRRRRGGEGVHRPGLVHRLDKETSGVLVIAKDKKALEKLSAQFEGRTVEKVYRAVVIGKVAAGKGEIVGSVGKDPSGKRMAVTTAGRYAKTDFKTLKAFPNFSYLEVYPRTGRTHQIRVHLAKIGHPVMGDPLYSKSENPSERMMLHAFRLSFRHPQTKKIVTFEAPVPADFEKILKSLQS